MGEQDYHYSQILLFPKDCFNLRKLIPKSSLTLLSPVMTMTRIPALRHSLMASTTSTRGGSNIPTTPTKVQLVSYRKNLVESSRSMSSLLTGLSIVARARQRRVSRPVESKSRGQDLTRGQVCYNLLPMLLDASLGSK